MSWGFEVGRVYSRQAVVVYLFPGGAAPGHSSRGAASLKAGIDALGARGDFQRHLCCMSTRRSRALAKPPLKGVARTGGRLSYS
jgi:hypothetical protein